MATGRTVAWVQTNVGTKEEAHRLAREVVDKRLAAAANLWPIESQFWWKGKLVKGNETTVVFRTSPGRLKALREAVRRLHPYRVAYISWGSGERVVPEYADWVTRETRPRPRRATRRKT